MHIERGAHKRRPVATAGVMLFQGPHARRYTQKAVPTQGGAHKRRPVATAGVMLSQGPQARQYTHNAVRTKGGRRFGRPNRRNLPGRRCRPNFRPKSSTAVSAGRVGRPNRRRVFRPRTAAEPHRRFIPMSSLPQPKAGLKSRGKPPPPLSISSCKWTLLSQGSGGNKVDPVHSFCRKCNSLDLPLSNIVDSAWKGHRVRMGHVSLP